MIMMFAARLVRCSLAAQCAVHAGGFACLDAADRSRCAGATRADAARADL